MPDYLWCEEHARGYAAVKLASWLRWCAASAALIMLLAACAPKPQPAKPFRYQPPEYAHGAL